MVSIFSTFVSSFDSAISRVGGLLFLAAVLMNSLLRHAIAVSRLVANSYAATGMFCDGSVFTFLANGG